MPSQKCESSGTPAVSDKQKLGEKAAKVVNSKWNLTVAGKVLPNRPRHLFEYEPKTRVSCKSSGTNASSHKHLVPSSSNSRVSSHAASSSCTETTVVGGSTCLTPGREVGERPKQLNAIELAKYKAAGSWVKNNGKVPENVKMYEDYYKVAGIKPDQGCSIRSHLNWESADEYWANVRKFRNKTETAFRVPQKHIEVICPQNHQMAENAKNMQNVRRMPWDFEEC